MITTVSKEHKDDFNKLATHPLQSWEWGDFRLKTGIEVVRLGRFERNKLLETAQVTFHPIPFTSYTIGYFPKGKFPSKQMSEELIALSKEKKSILIKIEPNIDKKDWQKPSYFDFRISPHPMFTKYTFQLDLTKSEDELLAKMHHKTRYNIRLAQKKGVVVVEDNSDQVFEKYLALMEETTIRQRFYAHSKTYHRLMWETMRKSGMAHLLVAKFKPKNQKEIILVCWILILFNGVLYYPYGASSLQFRQFMPSNLIMWEAIRFGKRKGARLFDMWGALGPKPTPADPWYGFHKFKEGYGGKLVELAGSYDLVVKSFAYPIFNAIQSFRNYYLNITAGWRR